MNREPEPKPATFVPAWGMMMRKLADVEEAKTLMNEAMEWSTFKWLFEKSRVREIADRANAALDRTNHATKTQWPLELKSAYKELTRKIPRRESESKSNGVDAQTKEFIEKVKAADDAAHRARMAAESTFDEAESRLSTDMAREGCRQAIHSWKLHEKAIRIAEAPPGSAEPAD